MKTLLRNKRLVYYALYQDKVELTDAYGNYSGEYDITYSDPVPLMANVSAAKGEADQIMFGADLRYDKTIVLDDPQTPIDENTVFWIDHQDTSLPHDYYVTRVSRSLNSAAIALTKVKIDA